MSANLASLQQLALKPSVVTWAQGLFHRFHLQIVDSGERFTIVHLGDRIEVHSGFEGEANFVVPLESQSVAHLASAFSDDHVDAHEEFRMVKHLLQPGLKAALAMPILSNVAFQRIVNIDTHWQEALRHPDGHEDEQLTVIFVNNQWLVIPGYHGRPQRRLVMTPDQVLAYQRRVFDALDKNNLVTWLELGRWYVQWRDQVSVPV